jgi:aspartate-semialdehyde dehydrogenase
VQTDADAPLLAQAHTAPVAAESKPVQRKRRADQVAPTTTTQPSAPAPEETPVVPPVARNERTELAFADTSTTVGRYEARQAQSQSQQAFAGGDAIIIGASTLVIVILIVLLVLLLV